MDEYHKKWGGVYTIDVNKSNCEVDLVFENLDVPKHLFSHAKKEEVEFMRSIGHGDTMKLSWFCHQPIMGLSCVHRNPCKDAHNEGMRWRLSNFGTFLGLCRESVPFVKRIVGFLWKR